MKIDTNSPTPDTIISSPAPANDATSASPISKNQVQNVAEDKTSLAFDRASIGALVSQAMTTPEIRQDKVDALRQAISSGQYQVEPGKVADSMLQESPKE